MKIPWTVRQGLGINKATAQTLAEAKCTAKIDGRTITFTRPDGSIAHQIHVSRGQIGNQSNAFRAVNQWNRGPRVSPQDTMKRVAAINEQVAATSAWLADPDAKVHFTYQGERHECTKTEWADHWRAIVEEANR